MITLAPFLSIALAWWGATPACGTPTVEYAPQPLIAQLTATPNAIGTEVDCRLLVADTLTDKGEVCKVVVHEYGHALGLGHSPTPGDIMHYTLPLYWPWCDTGTIVTYDYVETTQRLCYNGWVTTTPRRGECLTTRMATTCTRLRSSRRVPLSTSRPASWRTTWRSTCLTARPRATTSPSS